MEIDRESLELIAERAAERTLMECPSLDTANDFLEAMTIFKQTKSIMTEIFEEHITRLEKGYNRAMEGRQVHYDTGQLAEGTGGAPQRRKPSSTGEDFDPDEDFEKFPYFRG